MAVGAIIATVAGVGVKAVSTIMASKAAGRRARKEAELRELEADATLERAEINKQVTRRQFKRIKEQTITSFAAGNVDLGSGSPLQVLTEQRFDRNNAIRNINITAQTSAENIRAGAKSFRDAASGAETAGIIGGIGTVLTGGVSIAKAAGAFGK